MEETPGQWTKGMWDDGPKKTGVTGEGASGIVDRNTVMGTDQRNPGRTEGTSVQSEENPTSVVPGSMWTSPFTVPTDVVTARKDPTPDRSCRT